MYYHMHYNYAKVSDSMFFKSMKALFYNPDHLVKNEAFLLNS